MSFVTTGIQSNRRIGAAEMNPNLGSLGAWGQPVDPDRPLEWMTAGQTPMKVVVKLTDRYPTAKRPVIDTWVDQAAVKILALIPKGTWGTMFTQSLPDPTRNFRLYTDPWFGGFPAFPAFTELMRDTGGAGSTMSQDAAKKRVQLEWKEGSKLDFVKRYLIHPFLNSVLTGVGASSSPYGAPMAIDWETLALQIPLPPWYNNQFGVPTNPGFLPVGGKADWKYSGEAWRVWEDAGLWWAIPDGEVGVNTLEGVNAIANASALKEPWGRGAIGSPAFGVSGIAVTTPGWTYDRNDAEWMFPPWIWEKIKLISGESWRVNSYGETNDLRLTFHQRRGFSYVPTPGIFPMPRWNKTDYTMTLTHMPTPQEYEDYITNYNRGPTQVAHAENLNAVRVEVINKKTGEVIKPQEGEEKTLVALVAWNAGVSPTAKAEFAIRGMLTPINLPEVNAEVDMDGFGIKTRETEEQLDARLMAIPGAAGLIADIAVHPVVLELEAKAAAEKIETLTIVHIYGPVKDKKKKSFMKKYGVYVVAAIIVGAVIIAAIPAGGGAAATGAAGSTGAGTAAGGTALTATGTASSVGAGALTTAGAGGIAPIVAAPGVTGSGLLASAGKAIVAPAIKYGIAKAAGVPDAEKAALAELGGAVLSDVMPLLAKEVLPDGTVELTQSARDFIDTYIPESVQDLAEGYLKGEVKREVVEWALGQEEYDLPSGRSNINYRDLMNDTKENQPYYGGTPKRDDTVLKYAGIGIVGVAALLLLTGGGGVPALKKSPSKPRKKSRRKPRKRR